jgi:integrase/recombinase XerD
MPDSFRRTISVFSIGHGSFLIIRQIIHQYAASSGIKKRIYPHLFRHQIITFLTRRGIISPKLQLLSGHTDEKNLAIYRDLALADVSTEYQEAMRSFPIR